MKSYGANKALDAIECAQQQQRQEWAGKKDPTENVTNKRWKRQSQQTTHFTFWCEFSNLTYFPISQCEKGNKCTCILGFTHFFFTVIVHVVGTSPTVYILTTFQSRSRMFRMFRQRECIFEGKCRLRQSSLVKHLGLCVVALYVYKDMHPCLTCHAMPCIVMYFHLIFQSAIGCHDWCL